MVMVMVVVNTYDGWIQSFIRIHHDYDYDTMLYDAMLYDTMLYDTTDS